MKKSIFLTGLAAGCLLLCNTTFAQQLSIEKKVELTGRSKGEKGYLGNVLVDDAKKQFELVFVTKTTNRKIKFENYIFDYNLNLINNYKDEEEVVQAKEKHKWFNFRGNDVEVIESAIAEPNMTGKLVLKRIQTIYSYNWWRGKYETEIKVMDKVKPTEIAEDGDRERKLLYVGHHAVSSKGELLACAMINRSVKSMYSDGSREYVILRINNQLSITDKLSFTFDHPQVLAFSGEIKGTDADSDPEWALVFAPQGGQGLGKIQDPNPTNFTYFRVGADGKVKEKINFNTKCNIWGITDVYTKNADIFLYGPGSIDNPAKKYFYGMPASAEGRESAIEGEKFSHLQVMKISNGKVAFISAPGLDEINAKATKPAAQKKIPEFDGKKFVLKNVNVTSSGDIFLGGQDFKYDAVGAVKGRVYKNPLMFHFAADGSFKRYYSIENTQNSPFLTGAGSAKSFPTENIITESPNGQELIWQTFFVKDIDEDCVTETTGSFFSASSETMTTMSVTTCTYTPLFQLRLGKIDIASGSLSNFNNFGGEDFYLFMDVAKEKAHNMPFIHLNGGKELLYIARERKGGIKGNERWGNTIWLGKLDPASL